MGFSGLGGFEAEAQRALLFLAVARFQLGGFARFWGGLRALEFRVYAALALGSGFEIGLASCKFQYLLAFVLACRFQAWELITGSVLASPLNPNPFGREELSCQQKPRAEA